MLGSMVAAALPASRPNFLILFTDDQRFDTIRALGNSEIRTPNMDRLARRGVAMTHCFTQGGMHGAVCVASRAQLHTGQHLWKVNRNIVREKENVNGPPGPFHLFPEELRQNGYETCGIGKWHNQPELFNRAYSTGGPIFFGGMADHLKIKLQDYDATGKYPASAIHNSGRFSSEAFADAAIQFVRNRTPGARPWLCYVAFTSPHDPRMAPKPFSDWYRPGQMKLPKNFLPQHPFNNGELNVRDEMLAPHPRTEGDVRRHLAEYYAMISEVDAQIGRILDALEASGQANNTYIVFAGDNGLAIGQHGLFGKQNLYDHSWRVPLMISGPGLAAGKRSAGLCHIMDICPTILELAGVAIPPTVDARSLVPVLHDPREKHRERVYGAYRLVQRAIRDDRFKLIRYTVGGETRTQVFDLQNDPWELHPLPERGDLVQQLDSEMTRLEDPLS